MIKELHLRGYSSLYLYSGMSPNGRHWRYEIGQTENEQWPVPSAWIKGSIGTTGKTIWCDDNSSISQMVSDFEVYFKDRLSLKQSHTAYSVWYARVLANLKSNETLQFYADYGGKHNHMLKSAPGYLK